MENEPTVLKEASCPSLSATSDITYQIGTTPDGIVHVKVTHTSSSGIFNSMWVSLPKILAVLNDQEGPFIWSALCPLFVGCSVNSACFLMAALLSEGFVRHSNDQPRRYELGDTEKLVAEAQALASTPVKPKSKRVSKRPPPVEPRVEDPAVVTA